MITSYFKPKKALGSKRKGAPESSANDIHSKTKKKQVCPTNDEASAENPASVISSNNTPNVQALIDSLEQASWKEALQPTINSPTMERLANFVQQERRNHKVFPPPQTTWTALNACPLDQVKVVILGQDPYHQPGQAHGLAFSVLPQQTKLPPSLKNIYKELVNDPQIPQFKSVPHHGHLIRWAQQGVLLLNTVLTVRHSKPFSHQKHGWELVTLHILKALQGQKCVFLLWGKPALARMEAVHATSKPKHHVVIATSHPSPLGATKTKAPFLGSRCFGRCNQALIDMELEPIDWRVDGPLPKKPKEASITTSSARTTTTDPSKETALLLLLEIEK